MPAAVIDSRRLTGANLITDRAGAILDVAVAAEEADELIAVWTRHTRALLDAVGWAAEDTAHRVFDGGVSLVITAPIDALYAATALADAAFEAATADIAGVPVADRDGVVEALRAEIAAEVNPAVLALRAAAEAHGVAFLWDDDEVSVGLGAGSRTWAVKELPDPQEIDWDAVHDVPVALVTGTNGKSTTVRMLAAVLRHAGLAAGSTSTDGIHVGGEVLDTGDYSGPGGARRLLRDRRVGVGVLEAARGGLLRRGLPVERATAAIVTNIAEDHLGEYGVETLDDLAQAKLIVAKAVRDQGLLVLNADDELLVARARACAPLAHRIGWCSQNPGNPVVAAHVAAGGTAWVDLGGVLTERTPDGDTALVPMADLPATLGGAARHNVANALGVAALARGLGLSAEDVAAGLRSFRGDAADNPGRANRFDLGGATVLVDFAHNVHGMTAIAETAARLPARRRLVLFSQAGDRSDENIRALARTVWETGPDRVIAADVEPYLRGRAPGEVPALIRDELLRCGADPEAVQTAPSPVEGTVAAATWAEPGDVLLLMILSGRADVVAALRAAGATDA